MSDGWLEFFLFNFTRKIPLFTISRQKNKKASDKFRSSPGPVRSCYLQSRKFQLKKDENPELRGHLSQK